jgi:signal transduction histidine kinase
MKVSRTTIRRKLVTAIMLTSTIALMVTGTILIASEAASLRDLLATKLATGAEILAANSTAALAHQRPQDGRKILGALRADPSVVAAALYDSRGHVFATYPENAAARIIPTAPGTPGRRMEGPYLVIQHPVVEGSSRLGSLYIKTTHHELDRRIRIYAVVVLVAVASSIGIAFGLSAWLQRWVTLPLRVLIDAANEVSERKDYSLRVRVIGDDEFGLLAEAFNDMLAEIQERDAAFGTAEGRLRELNLDLERRVVTRTAELESSNRELEAFSYSVSHDLRAPLRAIDGFSKALIEDCGDAIGETGAQHLGRVRAATRQMGLLIDDMLSLSHLSRVEMRRGRVDLGAIGQEIATALSQSEPERSVAFVLARDMIVEGDSQLLRVVLDNLLRNAWKFTSRHPTARIELGHSKENGHEVYFVADDGAGFDMAHAALLFAPFQRLHRQSEFEGTGVGLATVQRIIHRHRGRLWAESTVEGGATFHFTLWETKP